MSKGTVFHTPYIGVLYIEVSSYFFCRVGLILSYAGDVAQRRTLDRAEQRISRVDRVGQGTTINHINTCYLKIVITAGSNATWPTEERRSCGARTTRSDQEHVRKSRRYNGPD